MRSLSPFPGSRWLGPLLVLTACTPRIDAFDVGSGEPGERLPVTASIDRNNTSVTPVGVAMAPAGTDEFGPEQPLAPTTGAGWAGQSPRLLPGDYQARLTVSYKRLFQSAVRQVTATRNVSVSWSDGTFAFENAGEGVAGWTFDGVYEAGTGQNVTTCDPLNPALLTRSPSGWPLNIGETTPNPPNGSLRVVINPTCFPASQSVGAPLWQFNLISPDLSGRDEWQDIDGVSFRMISAGATVQAQATVVYASEQDLDGDGILDNAFASPMASGAPEFVEVGPSWSVVERTGYVPEGRPIRFVMLRVFGSPLDVANLSTEVGTLLADVIQPIH